MMGKIKVYCFSHAGGMSYAYKEFVKLNDEVIEFHPIDTSGHGLRMKDDLLFEFQSIVDDLYAKILGEVNAEAQFVLLGHSMGAWIAYEIAYKLCNKRGISPLLVVLSSNVPAKYYINRMVMDQGDDVIMEQLIQQNEDLRQIFSDPSLKNIFYPIFKADYVAINDYLNQSVLNKNKLIESDIYCLIGDKDWVDKVGMQHWDEMTTGKCYEEEICGDHFAFYSYAKYIRKQIVALCHLLRSRNEEYMKGGWYDKDKSSENRLV
jgi:surfactin synthase thioesterase subunit